MKVDRLEIEAYRNLGNVSLIPYDGANIICGDNAQGKTNILEAIWLFTGQRSFRSVREKDFIPKDSNFAGLSFDFTAQGRQQNATIRWNEEKKQVTLNGVKKNTSSDLAGIFCGVIFSPDHLSLVKDGPENRRQMIDTSLSQAYPKYAVALSNYNKALKQRNTLLKDIAFNAGLLDLLDIWDIHIVNYGGYITALRDRYIRLLGKHSAKVYNGISGGKETFNINYEPSFGQKNMQGYTLDDFKNEIEIALKKEKGEDIRRGSTSIGPHRDDLDIKIDGMSARNFGSQGQQRSSILAMKLAECGILEEQNGESPVVMLDDVMSELDKSRQSYLLNKLKGKQVFITGCDIDTFSELEKGKIFFIKAGELTKEKERS